jgi:hypothetical protein
MVNNKTLVHLVGEMLLDVLKILLLSMSYKIQRVAKGVLVLVFLFL